MKIKRLERGFTIPELMVAILMTGFMATLIMYFTFMYWRSAFGFQADLETMVERMNASDFIREYVGSSSGLITQNSLADQHPDSLDASVSPPNYWSQIHAVPGTTTITGSGVTPLVYFRRPSLSTSGAFIMNGTSPYEDEFVLYVDNPSRKLKMRTIVNPAATNNRLKSSCPTLFVTTSCPADKEIIENIASVGLRYFSRSGNLLDYTSSTDPNTGSYNGPDFPVVEVAEITLNVSKRSLLQKSDTTVNSTVIRVALRNT